MNLFLTIKDVVTMYRDGCRGKCTAKAWVIFGKAILAGMMIAFGAAASSVVAHDISNVGLARLAAAVVFPVGLMMVILLGAELFTGDCLLVVALPGKEITPKQFVKTLALVYIGNFFGAVMLACLVAASGQLDYSSGLLGAYTIKVALGKATITPLKAVTSGILCNILVCAAVFMALCAKDIIGKIAASFFVIMLFVVAGFEHCVANMYYISAGILAKLNPTYASVALESYGYSAEQLSALSIKNMLITNLLPVTIGNIIGGVFFIGLPLYFLNRGSGKRETKPSVIKKKEGKHYGRNYPTSLSS